MRPDPELRVAFGGGVDGDEPPGAEVVGGFSHGLRLVSRGDRDVPDVLGAFVERLAEHGRAVASPAGPEVACRCVAVPSTAAPSTAFQPRAVDLVT